MTAPDRDALDLVARARHAARLALGAAGATTPLLLLDLAVLDEQLASWRTHLGDVDLFYAVKANSLPEVVAHLRDRGVGFDAATGGEVDLLAAHGIGGARLLCTHPIRDAADLRAVRMARPTVLVVQDADEVDKLAAVGVPSPDHAPTLLVRVALPFSNLDKFGARALTPRIVDGRPTWQVDASAVAAVLARARAVARERGVEFAGYGIAGHVGTNCADVDHFRMLCALFRHLHEELARQGLAVSVLDIGGGFCDRSTAARHGIDQQGLLAELATVIAETRQAVPGVRIVAEPGRFLVADAASLVVTVKSVRRLSWRQHPTAGAIDEDHLEVHIDDGIYGNLMGQQHDGRRWDFERLEPTPRSDAGRLPAVIWGATCDTFDRVEGLRLLPADLRAGDRLLVHAAGAYTVATSTRFNHTSPTSVYAFDRDFARVAPAR